MSTTTNLGLPLITGDEEIYLRDWILDINGEKEDSIANKIDAAITKAGKGNTIYAAEQPEAQENGDVWFEELTIK